MEAKKQTPSVGRVVHFVHGIVHVPAMIIDPQVPFADTGDSVQGLQVFTMQDGAFTTIAEHDETMRPGTWHWPEYVA